MNNIEYKYIMEQRPLSLLLGMMIAGFVVGATRGVVYIRGEYPESIKIVEEAIAFWNIESLSGLNEAGRKAQEKIMAIPKRLQKVAEYIESRDTSKTYSFDFIYGRILTT